MFHLCSLCGPEPANIEWLLSILTQKGAGIGVYRPKLTRYAPGNFTTSETVCGGF